MHELCKYWQSVLIKVSEVSGLPYKQEVGGSIPSPPIGQKALQDRAFCLLQFSLGEHPDRCRGKGWAK
jgi:hypothetical protein